MCCWTISVRSTIYYCLRKITDQLIDMSSLANWCRLLIVSSSLAAPRSTSSSWRLCWFTTATCTRDILSRTAAAQRRPAAPRPTAPSGSGCLTTLSAKPACARSCPPTLTCSSTRGWNDWASPWGQKSSRDERKNKSHSVLKMKPKENLLARVLVHNLCLSSYEMVEKLELSTDERHCSYSKALQYWGWNRIWLLSLCPVSPNTDRLACSCWELVSE